MSRSSSPRQRMDRRRHERFPVAAQSACAAVSPWATVTVDDLSTSGARLLADIRPAVGTGMLVSVTPDMMATGSVVRHTADGFAVSFGPLEAPPLSTPQD